MSHNLVAFPDVRRIERHEFDETYLQAVVASVASHVKNFIVVRTAFDNCVHLDDVEPSLTCFSNAGENVVEFIATCHRQESIGAQTIEADVDAVKTCCT